MNEHSCECPGAQMRTAVKERTLAAATSSGHAHHLPSQQTAVKGETMGGSEARSCMRPKRSSRRRSAGGRGQKHDQHDRGVLRCLRSAGRVHPVDADRSATSKIEEF